ncbi:MAG: helix-turn-helix domain-containing protein, partial [Bacteroidota bacterium]
LCTLLKQDALTSHLPVLLLTARHSDAAREEALRAGANDYLTKPFDLDFLLQKVDNTLATLTAARKRWIAQPSELSEEVIAAADTDQQFLNTLRKYVEENMDAPDLDLNALLRELAVSRSVCYAKVKALTGLPLKAFIKHLRIGRARQLLELTDQPVGDIAYQTGFKTTQHFSRSFREIVGSSPTNFRESVRV